MWGVRGPSRGWRREVRGADLRERYDAIVSVNWIRHRTQSQLTSVRIMGLLLPYKGQGVRTTPSSNELRDSATSRAHIPAVAQKPICCGGRTRRTALLCISSELLGTIFDLAFRHSVGQSGTLAGKNSFSLIWSLADIKCSINMPTINPFLQASMSFCFLLQQRTYQVERSCLNSYF